MWIIKLGGSLADSTELQEWLEALDAAPVVVVAGGGAFADQVRMAQGRWGFDDSCAHHLALLAMEQYGRMLCALQPGLLPASTIEEIRSILEQGKTPVWMPVEMVLGEPAIPHSWDVTSDSLSAWLCGRLHADGLLLVKSSPERGEEYELETLIKGKVIDLAFAEFISESDVPVWLLTKRDSVRLKNVLGGDMGGTTRVIMRSNHSDPLSTRHTL